MRRARAIRRCGAAALSLAGLLAVLALAAAPPAHAGSRSFTSPGPSTFTVPSGVHRLHVIAIGASGVTPPAGGAGGRGARVTGDLAVTPGQKLFVDVGAVGGADAGGGGGFNPTTTGGAGGGASHIATSETDLNARLIVAGGGGGGGRNGDGAGGAGGAAGTNGGGGGTGGASGGLAGGSTDGGDGGNAVDGFSGDDGELGAGGDGGPGVDRDSGGGGGGGGWYGGGGGGGCGFACSGGAGGGGGGSNHAGAGVSGFSERVSASAGNGSVALTWDDPIPAGLNASRKFASPGSFTFTVPSLVSSVYVVATGASGGTPAVGGSGVGGSGARVTGKLAVTPGQKLFVDVGAAGGADGGDGGSGIGGLRGSGGWRFRCPHVRDNPRWAGPRRSGGRRSR